jgi:4-aminobutyrate aminotransferase-like enzyme
MNTVSAETPAFSKDQVTRFVQATYALEVQSVANLGSFYDQNLLVTDSNGGQWVVKIHNATQRPASLHVQHAAMDHLNGSLSVAVPAVRRSVDEDSVTWLDRHPVQLLSYVSGKLLKDIEQPALGLMEKVGRAVGEMDACLAGLDCATKSVESLPWDLANTLQAKNLLGNIEDEQLRTIADYFMLQFETEVLPKLADLRHSVIHQDCHRSSVLISEDGDQVSGFIDFGDTTWSATVFNVAVAAYDAILSRHDGLDAAIAVVRGYHESFDLLESELPLLYYLVGGRLALYLCRAEGMDNTHVDEKLAAVRAALRYWIQRNPADAHDRFRRACNFPGILASGEETAAALEKRQRVVPGSVYTHYREPVYLESGALQYLYDKRGVTYLDCVNNVCQWGHCHPQIVRAIQRQAAKLNTNSRYLYDQLAAYAEALTATFPEPLDTCFLVNSGSEANDLALRLADAHTRHKEVVVLDKAYHGNSARCTEISPQRIDGSGKPGLPDHVHKLSAPDPFGARQIDTDVDEDIEQEIHQLLGELQCSNRGISAFIAESLIGTGGQIVLPPGFLSRIYHSIRAAGGVCIADEVQVGFGRTGHHNWCFESQGVVPDIVTMGKPMANGHPMAAVITRREIADSFDKGVTYFNTFGGNPVSCAAASAVLDLLTETGIKDNVIARSEQLMAGLDQIRDRHSCIADVRGQGLYIGVEIEDGKNSEALTGNIIESMKSRGILLNANGSRHNVIKIKPPLIVDSANIEFLLRTLDRVLTEQAN